MLYKYELHVHDKIVSACGCSTPEKMVEAYYKAGYSGMCFTNHFLLGNSTVNPTLPWEAKMHVYWDAYQRAVQYAADKDFDVLFGIEHHYGGGKEVLTYGIDLDFLLAHPDLHRYSIKDYCDAVHKAGGYISHAHPYRNRAYIDMNYPLNPELWDAVEVYNAYNHPNENRPAETLAAKYGLYRMSGGDEHFENGSGIGMAGMAFPYRIHTGKALVEALRHRDGRCIIDGKIE